MTLGSCFPVSSTLTTRCRRHFYDVDHSGTKISELFSVKFISRKNTYIHTYDVAEYYWILKNIRNPGFEFWKFRGKIGSRQIESLDLACV